MNTETVFESASLWRRLGAMVYDSFLIIAIWMVVTFIVLSLFGIDNARTIEGDTVHLNPLYRFVLSVALIVSAYGFFGWFWTHSGQTLGMQAWRIKVQNPGGSSISVKQSLIRFVLAPFSFLCLGAGYFYMLFNSNRETFHDRVSGSVVILVPKMGK